MAETKSSAKSPVVEAQPHGGVLQRGNPGNRGGPGRPPKTLRNLCHKRFLKHLPKVDRMLKAEGLKNADLFEAMKLFAKYGGEAAMPVSELRKRLQQQSALIREAFDAETAERITQVIRSAWVAG